MLLTYFANQFLSFFVKPKYNSVTFWKTQCQSILFAAFMIVTKLNKHKNTHIKAQNQYKYYVQLL
jgi:hypothetical protein